MSWVRTLMWAGRRRLQGDDRGSIAFALLAAIVVMGLTTVLVSTVVVGQQSTKFDTSFTKTIQGADAAIQQATFRLNNSKTLPTAAAPGTATLGDTSYTWFADKQSETKYIVYSTGTRQGVTRSVTAVLTQPARFELAVFADAALQFRGGNSATSYNSKTGLSTPGKGKIGSNGDVSFNGNAYADGVTLYDWATSPNSGRCSGSVCSGLTTVDAKLDLDGIASKSFVQEQIANCKASTPTLPAWKSSEHLVGGVATLPAGVQCYSNVSFDATTRVAGTRANPTRVYVEPTGQVTSSNGKDINYNALGTVAPALQIYYLGSTVAIGNQNNVGAAIWAPLANCGGNPSNAQTQIYGSLVCKTVDNQGGWGFNFDESLADVGNGQWKASNYAEN